MSAVVSVEIGFLDVKKSPTAGRPELVEPTNRQQAQEFWNSRTPHNRFKKGDVAIDFYKLV